MMDFLRVQFNGDGDSLWVDISGIGAYLHALEIAAF
jgi:hypothetical protein